MGAEWQWYRDPSSGLERAVQFVPGRDGPSVEDGHYYAVTDLQIRWLLRGPRGVAQFVLGTDWLPTTAAAAYARTGRIPATLWAATPQDLGSHTETPQGPWDRLLMPACPYLDSRPCFYEGSTVDAEAVYAAFTTEGEPAIWRALMAKYQTLRSPDAPPPNAETKERA